MENYKTHDNNKILNLKPIDKDTRLKQQRLIHEVFNYRHCDAYERQQIVAKARKAATVCNKPIYIFREIMNYLANQLYPIFVR